MKSQLDEFYKSASNIVLFQSLFVDRQKAKIDKLIKIANVRFACLWEAYK